MNRTLSAHAIVILAMGGLLVAPLGLPARAMAQDTVSLRPVDQATVRLISMSGVDGARDASGALRLGVRVSHGSGVFVDRDGLIATAAHVVRDADYLVAVQPGEDRGRPAEVVYRSEEHDVALVRVGGSVPGFVAVSPRPGLRLGQTLHVSGYPLDPRERWPAAASGEVGRPLNDGRVQLSMSVNPGNSGGPVVNERGELVGIVTQGADPTAGAQGLAIMEPIALLAAHIREATRGGRSTLPIESDDADILLEQLHVRPFPANEARFSRMREANASTQPSAALFTVEAVELQHRLLEEAGVTAPLSLPAVALERYQYLRDAAARWSAVGRGDAEGSDRYQALSAVATGAANGVGSDGSPIGGASLAGAPTPGSSAPSISGAATGPSPFAPAAVTEEEHAPVVSFALGAEAGMAFSDLPGQDAVDGGLGGVNATIRLFLGYHPYFRFALEAGGTFVFGGWRGYEVASTLGATGARFEIGPTEFSVFVSGAYTPGYVLAESREHVSTIGYQVGAGVKLGILEIGLAWRELSRGAGSPLRSLFLTTTVELTP